MASAAPDEAVQVYTDIDTVSSVNAITEPFPLAPVAPDGHDLERVLMRGR